MSQATSLLTASYIGRVKPASMTIRMYLSRMQMHMQGQVTDTLGQSEHA